MLTVKQKDKVREKIRWLMRSGALQLFFRLGYGTKGLVYLTMGVLSWQLGQKINLQPPGQTEALSYLKTLGPEPYLLGLIFVGLSAYVLWGLARAGLDVVDQRYSITIWRRVGFLISAASYLALALFTGLILWQGQPAEFSRILSPWEVGLIGLISLVMGVSQIVAALNLELNSDWFFLPDKQRQTHWKTLVSLATAGRAVVFCLVGLSFLNLARLNLTLTSPDVGKAVQGLAFWPFGGGLIFVVGGLLMGYGCYSMGLSGVLGLAGRKRT